MHRLILAFLLALPSAAMAQDYLSPEDFAALTTDNAFCYFLQVDGSCNWVELYEGDPGPDITLRLATILTTGEMAVIAQQATWVGDAMCIRDGDFGIVGMDFAAPPYFHFNLRDLAPQPPEAVQAMIDDLAPSIASKTCFRFAPDAARPGGYVQHIFADGTRRDGEDPITLVSLSQASVLLVGP